VEMSLPHFDGLACLQAEVEAVRRRQESLVQQAEQAMAALGQQQPTHEQDQEQAGNTSLREIEACLARYSDQVIPGGQPHSRGITEARELLANTRNSLAQQLNEQICQDLTSTQSDQRSSSALCTSLLAASGTLDSSCSCGGLLLWMSNALQQMQPSIALRLADAVRLVEAEQPAIPSIASRLADSRRCLSLATAEITTSGGSGSTAGGRTLLARDGVTDNSWQASAGRRRLWDHDSSR
jgi:hypothetical protein